MKGIISYIQGTSTGYNRNRINFVIIRHFSQQISFIHVPKNSKRYSYPGEEASVCTYV